MDFDLFETPCTAEFEKKALKEKLLNQQKCEDFSVLTDYQNKPRKRKLRIKKPTKTVK